MTSNNFIKISQIVVLVLFLISFSLNVYLLFKNENTIGNEIIIEKIDTLRDTIKEIKPQVKYETYVKTIKDTLVQSITNHDTVKVVANIPITQKTYTNDTTYKAWVSGYRQNLDSIHVYNKTIEKYTEKITVKKPTFVIGPTVVGGYDPIHNKFSGMVGVGITYNLFQIK